MFSPRLAMNFTTVHVPTVSYLVAVRKRSTRLSGRIYNSLLYSLSKVKHVAPRINTTRMCNRKQVTEVVFEVFTEVIMKNSISWDKKPCSPLKYNRRFREHVASILNQVASRLYSGNALHVTVVLSSSLGWNSGHLE